MNQILITCREASIAAIPLIPIFLVLHHRRIQDKKRSLIYLTLAVYLAAMYAAVGLPDITYWRYKPHFNFIPFQYMFSAWETTLLNVLLFLPLGWFLPTLWLDFKSPARTIFFGLGISLTIELLQIFTFRASDINDLITNTFGTFLGYLLGRLTQKRCPVISPQEYRNDMGMVFGTAFLVMFFVYPFLCKLIW